MSLAHRLILLLNSFAIVTSILTACHQAIDPKTAGATAAAAATGQDYLVTVKDKVPLYFLGPQQLAPPDHFLNKNDLVRVVKAQLGFSLVQTSEGQVGWVPTEDLAVAPGEVLLGAGLAYEAPSFRPEGIRIRSGTKKSNYPSERDTAIVQPYRTPDSDFATEPTPSPSPSPSVHP